MNAEDLFLKKYGNKITASESWVIRFAEEYADQETERLKAELEAKDKEIERLKNNVSYEILEKHFNEMYKYNKELLSELSELKAKDKEINKHLDISFALQSELNKINSKHVTEITMRNKRINDLEYKLTELKERHKGDVCGFTEWIRKQIVSNSIKCYEDDGKFTLWKPYTPYGSRLTVIELYDYYKQKFEK